MFQSHTYEPNLGDFVVNTNQGCRHCGSIGVVVNITQLPEDMGKTIKYMCVNDGDCWESGDMLDKTLDQLEPYKEWLGSWATNTSS